MAISKEQRAIVELIKCCGVSKEEAIEIGIMTSEQKAAELLIDWFIEQDEMPTPDEIYQAAIEATLEVDEENLPS